MTQETLIHISGFIAAALMTLGYVPQTIRTIRTRSTDDIAVPTFLLMGLGGLFFMINGFLTANYYLAGANLLTTTMSAIIFTIKMSNDFKKKRRGK